MKKISWLALAMMFISWCPLYALSKHKDVKPIVFTQPWDKEKQQVKLLIAENHVKVENAPIGSKLEVYSIVGIKVLEIEMKQASGQYLINLNKGYYIIRIENTVRKIAIR